MSNNKSQIVLLKLIYIQNIKNNKIIHKIYKNKIISINNGNNQYRFLINNNRDWILIINNNNQYKFLIINNNYKDWFLIINNNNKYNKIIYFLSINNLNKFQTINFNSNNTSKINNNKIYSFNIVKIIKIDVPLWIDVPLRNPNPRFLKLNSF